MVWVALQQFRKRDALVIVNQSVYGCAEFTYASSDLRQNNLSAKAETRTSTKTAKANTLIFGNSRLGV